MDDDDVEGCRRHREIVDVALPHRAIAQVRALYARAREQQHVEREVDAEPAVDLRAKQLEDTTRAGAEVEQRMKQPVAARFADGLLGRFLGAVESADAMPLP